MRDYSYEVVGVFNKSHGMRKKSYLNFLSLLHEDFLHDLNDFSNTILFTK